jgi:hypothetical protein
MATNRTTATIQWRPEVNALTTPPSYRLLFLPRGTVGDAQLAAEIAKANPNFNEEAVRTILNSRKEIIQQHLLNGEQVVEENAFTTTLSLTGRLDSPDDPLPPLDECLQVRIHASQPFIEAIRRDAKTERLPEEKKLPLISTVQDTVLELKDVPNPAGLLQLTGADLQFDRKQGSGCVIEGTAGGKTTQTRFGKIEDSEIIVMPVLPAQAHPWNNEVSTRSSERGTLRTGTYGRMLRSPLTLTKMGHPNPPEVGILTGKAAAPYVSVTGGSVAADATREMPQHVMQVRASVSALLAFDLLRAIPTVQV